MSRLPTMALGLPGEMGDAPPEVDLGAGRAAVAVAAGSQHACAILDDGTLERWGAHFDGQLVLGDVEARGPVAPPRASRAAAC